MQSDRKRQMIALSLLLAVSTLAAYWGVWGHEFITYDDPQYVSENPRVLEGFTFRNVQWAFTSGQSSNWHPLTWMSLMLDSTLFGIQPAGFHTVNLILHAANVLLLFLVLVKLGGGIWPSVLVAAVFGLHPLHVESVAWVSERKDVLSTLFWMLTMLCYARYVKKPGFFAYSLTMLCFTLGLMAKPMLVTLPFVLLLVDYWPLGRMNTPAGELPATLGEKTLQAGRLIVEKIPFFILSAASCAVTFLVQRKGGSVSSFEGFTMSQRLANAIVSCVDYIRQMFRPTGLSVFYPHPKDQMPDSAVAFSVIVLIAITAIAGWQIRRKPYLLVGWLWYLGTLVPVIGLVQVGEQARADRYTYIPLTGLFIMLIWLAWDFTAAVKWARRLVITAGVAVCAVLLICTFRQAAVWQNSRTLFEHALKQDDKNYVALHELGIYYAEAGDLIQAMQYFGAVLAIKPNSVEAHYNLGHALMKTGNTDQAAEHFKMVLQAKPNDGDVFNTLAIAELEKGNLEEAEAFFQKGLTAAPKDAKLHSGLGLVWMYMGRIDPAIRELETAIALRGDSETYCNLGAALLSKGQTDNAKECFEKAVRLDPGNAQAYFNLGNIALGTNHLAQAIDQYVKAIELEPGYIKAHGNLAVALAQAGRIDEAIVHFTKVAELAPDSLDAHANLARALEQKGDTGAAIEQLRKVAELAPMDAEVCCKLADLLIRQGHAEEAVGWYKRVLEINPQHPQAQKGLQNADRTR